MTDKKQIEPDHRVYRKIITTCRECPNCLPAFRREFSPSHPVCAATDDATDDRPLDLADDGSIPGWCPLQLP